MCTQCCQFLWIVHCWLPLLFSLTFIFGLCRVYTMLPVSLDCSFLVAPSVFSNVYLWPCYCTVHAYVVIYICDNMWSFWMKANMSGFVCYHLFPYVIVVKHWILHLQFNPPHFVCLSQTSTWISNVIYRGILYGQSVEVIVDC